jgi:hypothetical protein
MTKAAALNEFFNSFDVPGYPSPSGTYDFAMPYLTYENRMDAWGGGPVNITVQIWIYTDSEKQLNDTVNEISKALASGVRLTCDEGIIRLYRGGPWCIPLVDESNKSAKGRQLNITANFETLF